MLQRRRADNGGGLATTAGRRRPPDDGRSTTKAGRRRPRDCYDGGTVTTARGQQAGNDCGPTSTSGVGTAATARRIGRRDGDDVATARRRRDGTVTMKRAGDYRGPAKTKGRSDGGPQAVDECWLAMTAPIRKRVREQQQGSDEVEGRGQHCRQARGSVGLGARAGLLDCQSAGLPAPASQSV